MLEWIRANVGNIIAVALLSAIVIAIVNSLVKQKKQGKSSCGGGCASCPMSGACHSGKCCTSDQRQSKK